MTEEEVIRALGTQPERRKENGRQVEATFKLVGAVPGYASASFLGGPLTYIEFSPARVDDPPLPRVSEKGAQSLALGALAFKAIDHTLEMTDVLQATGAPGRRVSWKLSRSFDGGKPKTRTSTTWFWEVEPGGKVLIVVETDGQLDQPFIRDLPHVLAGTNTTTERVTREELTTFLDWQVEMRNLMLKTQEEAKAVVNRTVDLDARMEVMKRNQALAQPLLAREPFKDSRKGSAMRAVLDAFYVSGTFFRDEKELARLRASYGKEFIDSIADQEALFRKKLP